MFATSQYLSDADVALVNVSCKWPVCHLNITSLHEVHVVDYMWFIVLRGLLPRCIGCSNIITHCAVTNIQAKTVPASFIHHITSDNLMTRLD